MSINIQTSDGLKKLADKTTKKNIKEALGYIPSYTPNINDYDGDTFYIADSNGNVIFKVDKKGIHSIDLTLNNKSLVDIIKDNVTSGDYNDLENAPDILDDGSSVLNIVDSNGNIIFKVDKDGVHTVGLKIKNKSLDTIIEENTPSGDYNELENKPEILEDGSAFLQIVDVNGNVIAMIDDKGVHAFNFYAGVDDDEVALKKDIPAEVSLDEINKKISNLETTTENLPTLESDVKTLGTNQVNMQGEILTLQNNQTTFDGELETVKSNQQTMSADVDTLKTNQGKTNTSIQNLQTEQNKLNDKVDNIIDDESEKIQFVDDRGNIVMEVDGTGLNVVDVKINGISLSAYILKNITDAENNSYEEVTFYLLSTSDTPFSTYSEIRAARNRSDMINKYLFVRISVYTNGALEKTTSNDGLFGQDGGVSFDDEKISIIRSGGGSSGSANISITSDTIIITGSVTKFY